MTFFWSLGGVSDSDLMDSLFIFDWTSQTWTEMEPMPTARADHGCGLVTTQERGQEIVVVGGIMTDSRATLTFNLETSKDVILVLEHRWHILSCRRLEAKH